MNFDYMGYDFSINEELMGQLVVIDDDRYSGAYSGAAYTAWRGGKPDDIDAGDVTCEEFWRKYGTVMHGRGDTPQAAFLDLKTKFEATGYLFMEPLLFVLAPDLTYGSERAFLAQSDEFKEWLAA